MDSQDLLARENEFKKLNKQLEKKTERLMKEIEDAMKKKDIFSEFSCNLTLNPRPGRSKRPHCGSMYDLLSPKESSDRKNNLKKNYSNSKTLNIDTEKQEALKNSTVGKPQKVANITDANTVVTNAVCHCCIAPNRDTEMEFMYAFTSVSVKDNILPQCFLKENVTFERVCKFLSAKIKLVQDQVEKLQSAIDKKGKQCEGHMRQLAEMEGEKLNLLNKANTMKSETADMRAKYGVILNKFNEKERQYKEQRSIIDGQTTELKKLKWKITSLDARCASQEELITTLKHQVETAKLSEKEMKETSRNLSLSHQAAISLLEQRVKLLTSTIDKQTALIDNLRKQNALLKTEGALATLEKEYSEFLNQDF